MTLYSLVVTIVIVGLILWAIDSFVPMDPKVRSLLRAVVVIGLIFWVLQEVGIVSTHVRLR